MILYFSGTGNSEYAAKRIGKEIGDEVLDLFENIRKQDYSPLTSDRPWVVVAPTYAWRIPRIVHDWLRLTELRGSREIYFVMTCDGSNGNAAAYLKKLCESKGMNSRGCASVLMPENYIALFCTPGRKESLEKIERAESKISDLVQYIRSGKTFPKLPVTAKDKFSSGFVNDIFYPLFVHAKKFYATDSFISCGKCAALCPLGNISMNLGKPDWGKSCTHCMACINRCPRRAIEYGKHSKGMERYICPKKI